MDRQFNPQDSKGQVSFYKHQIPQMYEEGREYRSSLYRYRSEHDQVPLNFIGRRTLRTLNDGSRVFNPMPMDGVWYPEKHVPLMRGLPITPRFT